MLRCPLCSAPLEARGPGDKEAGCARGHRFSAANGYLDLSRASGSPVSATTNRTFESFGYEWNTFGDVREEDDEFAEVYFRDLDLPSLDGLDGVDAGCGKGRYSRYVAEHLGSLVALDGSSAVEAASRNLAPYPDVLVVKSDLRSAPVSPKSVDFLMCLGVLHHLEDPEEGFRRLVEWLAPGGRMLLYLYSRPTGLGLRSLALATSAWLRRYTTRLPHRALQGLCVPIATVLYLGVVGLGSLGDRYDLPALSRLPMSAYRGKPFRSLFLDTFDRLSAPVEHRYVWEELSRWFSDAGLNVEAVREETGWFVLCRKPAA